VRVVLQDTSAIPQGAVITVDPEAVLVDRRVLAFRPASLIAAVEGPGRARLDLPKPAIQRAELIPAEQIVRFHFGEPPDVQCRSFGCQELGALLIAYCIGVRVPLPARAAKAVTITSWGVVLDFVLSFLEPPRWERPFAMPPRAKPEPAGR
jgi:hypothetical protein